MSNSGNINNNNHVKSLMLAKSFIEQHAGVAVSAVMCYVRNEVLGRNTASR